MVIVTVTTAATTSTTTTVSANHLREHDAVRQIRALLVHAKSVKVLVQHVHDVRATMPMPMPVPEPVPTPVSERLPRHWHTAPPEPNAASHHGRYGYEGARGLQP